MAKKVVRIVLQTAFEADGKTVRHEVGDLVPLDADLDNDVITGLHEVDTDDAPEAPEQAPAPDPDAGEQSSGGSGSKPTAASGGDEKSPRKPPGRARATGAKDGAGQPDAKPAAAGDADDGKPKSAAASGK